MSHSKPLNTELIQRDIAILINKISEMNSLLIDLVDQINGIIHEAGTEYVN